MIWNILPFRMIDIIVGLAKILTGAQAVWKGSLPDSKQRIYFANHTSNLDTIIIWSSLPFELRKTTRPVAAKDYWNQPGIKQHIATKELNVVFVERNKEKRTGDPLDPLREALIQGNSLIVFPEGQRNKESVPGDFKSGIFRLHQEFPDVELIPVYLENVAKTFPRGAFFPLPIICKARFGAAFKIEQDNPYMQNDEKKTIFLKEARLKVIDLIPEYVKSATPDFTEKVKNPPVRGD